MLISDIKAKLLAITYEVWHLLNSHNLKFLNVYQNETVFYLTLFRLDVGKK